MKKLSLVTLLVAFLSAVFVTANVALAGNGVTTTHFTVVYENSGPGFDFGLFTCAGQRIVKTGPNGFVKDSETCKITDPVDVAPNGHYDAGGWVSDYEAFVDPGGFTCFNPAISGTIDVTANGRTWIIEAYYDPGFTC